MIGVAIAFADISEELIERLGDSALGANLRWPWTKYRLPHGRTMGARYTVLSGPKGRRVALTVELHGMSEKLQWHGTVHSVQARIRLFRSFDERSHGYLGYCLRLQGRIGHEDREFSIGIGKAAQAKHGFQVGDTVSGEALPVLDDRLEPVEFYKASRLKVIARGAAGQTDSPPWHGPAVALEVYRERGHRRLDARTYASKCISCVWGCRMPVEMTIDHWKPRDKRYRFETFCYGPKSCPLYKAGPTRKVPGRKGMSYEEEDWVDEDATSHRGLDD